MLDATALRSTKAGLLALGIVSFALATFGPWFNLLVGYGLMIASVAVAVVGILWADRSAHEIRRTHDKTNGGYAKHGAPLFGVSLILSTYYTRFLGLVLFTWPLLFFSLLLSYAFY